MSSGPSSADLARVQVQLATAAADATPLQELDVTTRDLTRVQPLLQQVLAAVAELLGTTRAALWVIDPVQPELYPVVWTGLPDDYIAPLRVPFGGGSAGRAVAERRPVLVTDMPHDPSYSAYVEEAHAHGLTCAFSMPMLTLTGEPMGSLTAYYAEPHEPGEREVGLVELYARQAAEIVERARLHAEARMLADLERRRAAQLRALATAALQLSAADTLDDLLRIVTESARSIIGTHQGVASRLPDGWTNATTYVSLSEQYAAWRAYDVVPEGKGVLEYVTRENKPLRLDGDQLRAHPEFRGLRDAPGHPPMPDYLAAPLIGRTGVNLGLVQLSHKLDETPFSAEDEAIVVQLAQMASSAVEALEALARERAARREAELAAAAQAALSQASATFAELLDPEEVGSALTRLVVPRLAELAVLHLIGDDGRVRLAAVEAVDPSIRAAAHAFLRDFEVTLDQPYGTSRTASTSAAGPGSRWTTRAASRSSAGWPTHCSAACSRAAHPTRCSSRPRPATSPAPAARRSAATGTTSSR
ncbi:MAG: GAF domain-containing protein [Actinobacteria bacterium]|nr:GAF domain-containing protein [Actinomycetota bacterium]